MSLPDAPARLAIEEELNATLIVEAAAGTGKTTALVRRILALVIDGQTRLSRIVALSFTDKAAGEMKIRLRQAIEERRGGGDGEGDGLLVQALSDLESARIATIHSFAHDILRERPVEAGIDPLFEVLPDPEARQLFSRVFDLWFQRCLQNPPEGVSRLLRRAGAGRESSPRAALKRAGWQLCETRDFPGAWERTPRDRSGELERLLGEMKRLGALGEQAFKERDYLAKGLLALKSFVSDLESRERLRGRDLDAIEAELRRFLRQRSWGWRGGRTAFGPGLDREEIIARRDALKQGIQELLDGADADLAALLHAELRSLVEEYQEGKAQSGRLDFLDLLLITRELLGRDAEVRTELQARFSRILVDEFQDTDPLQAEIILLLCGRDPANADPASLEVVEGKLFVVGDPKQSIYRFRRADPLFYEAFKKRLLSQGARLVQLSASFRSDPRIQAFVNAAFAKVMRGGSQARYVPLDPVREESAERPAVIVLPVPHPYGSKGSFINKRSVEESTPEAIGAFVAWLCGDSGWRVSSAESGEALPLEARHICLLFKAFRSPFGSATEPYTAALERRGIAAVLVGGRSFHDREEVLALRTALCSIEWPDDELSVYATLKGPLFALGDERLLRWRGEVGRLHPLRPVLPPGDEELAQVSEALSLLAELHHKRQRRGIAATIEALLEGVRAHAGFLLWHGGEQVLGNVLRLQEMARRFERRSATSFRSFLLELEREAERGEGQAEAAVVEEGTEGVRLMTVHRAKGLEFPVAIVCDFFRPAQGQRPSRVVDLPGKTWFQALGGCVPAELLDRESEILERDREESERLLYVAATRARDLLVLPAVGDRPPARLDWFESTWTGAFEGVIRPAGRPQRAPGCPPMGAESVLLRPPGAEVARSMKPGRYRRAGGIDFCWWDPALLPAAPERRWGVRRKGLLARSGGGSEPRGADRDLEAWLSRREKALKEGSQRTRETLNPSSSEVAAPMSEEPRWEKTEVSSTRGALGRRFGSLVHEVMGMIDLDAEEEAIGRCVSYWARRLAATSEEQLAANEAVRAALDHPLIRSARDATDIRREVPLHFECEDGLLVEGIIDLAFCSADGLWNVVEFKTSPGNDEDRRRYQAQLSWYLAAVEEVFQQGARPSILLI